MSTTETAGKSQDTEPLLTELPTVSDRVEVTQTTSDAAENTDSDYKANNELVSLEIKSLGCSKHKAKIWNIKIRCVLALSLCY